MSCRIRLRTAMHLFAKDVYSIRWAIMIIAIYAVAAQVLFGTICPFRIMTGLDCPACGLTRGCVCVLTGHWRKAVEYNPTSFAWVLLIAWLLLRRYLYIGKNIRWEIPVIPVSLGTVFFWVLHTAAAV